MSLQIVQSVRSKYPTPLGADHPAFLLEVAAKLGKGLLKKTGGTRIFLPDGTGVSQDCVMDPDGKHWDILSDGEGAAEPRFDLLTNPDGSPYLTSPSNYYPVAPILNPTVPEQSPPTLDLAEIVSVLNEIKSGLEMLEARTDNMDLELNNIKAQLDLSFSELTATTDALETKLDEIINRLKNPPFYKTRVLGANVTLNPELRIPA